MDLSLDISSPSTNDTSTRAKKSSGITLEVLLQKYFEVDNFMMKAMYECKSCSSNQAGQSNSNSSDIMDRELPKGNSRKKAQAGEEHEGSSSDDDSSDGDSSSMEILSDSMSSISLAAPEPDKSIVLRPAEKWYKVESLPDVLVFHIKRFSAVCRGRFIKSADRVCFPSFLDMSLFCMSSSLASSASTTYELYATVVHIGSTMESGHYVANVKMPSDMGDENSKNDPRWFHCSDSSVVQTDESKAMSGDVYILFYRRIEH